MIERTWGVTIAVAMPWTTRPAIRMAEVCAMPQTSDASANSVRPTAKTRRRPYRSPSRPEVIRALRDFPLCQRTAIRQIDTLLPLRLVMARFAR